jgi:hypothetical protein
VRTLVKAAMVLLAALASGPASAHDFHASLANVEYNEETKSAEVSLRLFTEDLEESLTRRNGKRVRIGLTPGAERLAFEYISSVFRIKDEAGTSLELSWVGLETKADVVWAFVEAKAPGGLAAARVENRIFLDLFDDQENLVVVKQGTRRASLVFKRGTVELPVKF